MVQTLKHKSGSRSASYGLGRKLTLVFGGLISVFVAAVIYINVQIQIDLVHERVDLRSQQLVQLGVEVSLPYLIEGRPAELEAIFEEISGQPDVDQVYLLDEFGNLLVDGSDIEIGLFLAQIEDPLAQRAFLAKTQLHEVNGNIESLAHPIFLGNTSYGIMRMDIRLDTLQSEIETVWTRNALVGVIFVILGIVISNLLARRLTGPLIQLTRATERAAAGELSQNIKVHTNDEIESLADSFASMLDTMRDSMQQIHRLAYLDEMTNIPNRTWFRRQIDQITAQPLQRDVDFAVMFLDIDNFKAINDRHGHHIGDEFLTTFANRLTDCVARTGLTITKLDQTHVVSDGTAIIARLGGDEFTLIAPTKYVELISQKILTKMSQPIGIGSLSLPATTSIGIGIFPDQAQTSDELLKIADTAMYQAKQAGKNCYRFYNEDLHRQQLDKEEMRHDLKLAIRDSQFVMFLQPQFDVTTGRVSGAEALVRWQHPTKGLLTPDKFLPLGADLGLLPDLGRETTRLAIALALDLQLIVEQPFVLAMNLSVEELMDAQFILDLADLIERSGVDPYGLEIEITENTAMFDSDIAAERIETLRALGLRLAIDDFGVGYSNLGRLKTLAFDTIKIDRSLLDGVENNPDTARLLTALFDLSRSINADVVAEGVESAPQLAFLKAHHCKSYQGYYGGRPMPSDVFETWLRSQYNQIENGQLRRSG